MIPKTDPKAILLEFKHLGKEENLKSVAHISTNFDTLSPVSLLSWSRS